MPALVESFEYAEEPIFDGYVLPEVSIIRVMRKPGIKLCKFLLIHCEADDSATNIYESEIETFGEANEPHQILMDIFNRVFDPSNVTKIEKYGQHVASLDDKDGIAIGKIIKHGVRIRDSL